MADLVVACPFGGCGFSTPFQYEMLLHIETDHSEGPSLFVAHEGNSLPLQQQQQQQHSSHTRNRPTSLAAAVALAGGAQTQGGLFPARQTTLPPTSPPPPAVPPKSPQYLAPPLNISQSGTGPTTTLTPTTPSTPTFHDGEADDEEAGYVECPVESCGEIIGLSEMDYHLELHSMADTSGSGTTLTMRAGLQQQPQHGHHQHHRFTLGGGSGSGSVHSSSQRNSGASDASGIITTRPSTSRSSKNFTRTSGLERSASSVSPAAAAGAAALARATRSSTLSDAETTGHTSMSSAAPSMTTTSPPPRSPTGIRRPTSALETGSGSGSVVGKASSRLLNDRQRKAISDWKLKFSLPTTGGREKGGSGSGSGSHKRVVPARGAPTLKAKRLGKNELGRFAHEKKMPLWLVSLLQRGGQVRSNGIIPVIEGLLRQSEFLEVAYLCHPSVSHISKLRRESGFCGYRNIQMLISYILGAEGSQGKEHFVDKEGGEGKDGGLPSVFELQEHIEEAWDRGINAYGRVETGGVRGTRKFIGTPEAQAVFTSLGISCDVGAFKDKQGHVATDSLLSAVESYFQSGITDPSSHISPHGHGNKVHATDLPPIYFQHRGHSLTIIGLEKQKVGAYTFTNLLVFDPSFPDSVSLTRLAESIAVPPAPVASAGEGARAGRASVDGRGHGEDSSHERGGGKAVGRERRHRVLEFQHKNPDKALNAYRRNMRYLQRYHDFEILMLLPPSITGHER